MRHGHWHRCDAHRGAGTWRDVRELVAGLRRAGAERRGHAHVHGAGGVRRAGNGDFRVRDDDET